MDQLLELIDGDEKKARDIFKVKEDVEKYLMFKRALDLGITFNKNDLTFTEFLLYSFIKEELKDG